MRVLILEVNRGSPGGGGKAGQKATKGAIVSGVFTAIHGAHMDVQVRV